MLAKPFPALLATVLIAACGSSPTLASSPQTTVARIIVQAPDSLLGGSEFEFGYSVLDAAGEPTACRSGCAVNSSDLTGEAIQLTKLRVQGDSLVGIADSTAFVRGSLAVAAVISLQSW